ncbi:CPBP family intramembrane glutamic endopeptidase [Clostridium baratii]|uniref:CAAX protease self-immunity family protein n=1 Tax=Clostridium baratii str. Sullivan TaxID=1415775 RepID=A0A0A7FU42_9CLOT|nr:CPBP family intramembrane glutamic endopeptidase [Clostridium baratii]AIY83132.1 CAAX protease self-immunity family protein [Clostridium baratii str. Sullivan]MDU4912796.1 CPBP family intramembrane glutamic endopeptidase [Clostridium baratii]
MRKIKELIYKFDNIDVKPISILGGIGFSILFTIVLMITTLLGMLIITPALESLGSMQESSVVVQIINGISEIGVQILAYCATITFMKKRYIDKSNDDITIEYTPVVKLKGNDYIKLIIFSLGEITFVLGLSYFLNLIPIPEFIQELISGEDVAYPFLVTLIIGGILAPIVEEILFRGMLLKGLLKKYSLKKSAIVGGGMFSILHLPDIQNVLAIIVGSIIYSFVYAYTRSIVPTIILHMSYNTIATLFDELTLRLDILNEGFSNIQPIILIAIGAFIMITCYKGMRLKDRYKEKLKEAF